MTAVARIDRGAFARNVRTLVDRCAPAEVMLAVKADAYGHGMLDLAPVALEAGATSLAVLEIPAALALRSAGIQNRLFAWLHGEGSDFRAAIEADVDLGISSLAELNAVASVSDRRRPARVHLKIDTGLHRNGALPEEWPGLLTAARDYAHDGLVVVEGIWSHLADASPADDAEAITAFEGALTVAATLGVSPRLRHLAASSAGWREPRARFDLVRFGIAAYGISPFDEVRGVDLGLSTVMTLTTTVSDAVAPRGHRWIAAGYGDGVPATARDAEVVIAGHRARIHTIEVDRTLVVVDTDVAAGADVVIFGDPTTGAPSAEDWAAWARTIGDEIVTGAGSRARREFVG